MDETIQITAPLVDTRDVLPATPETLVALLVNAAAEIPASDVDLFDPDADVAMSEGRRTRLGRLLDDIAPLAGTLRARLRRPAAEAERGGSQN